ncbi:MAG: type II toxin-antitoxin system PemK/MazF family toxin [Casimicrobiaceae bacterium]
MTKPIAIFDPDRLARFDIVIVPFPFTDKAAAKRRPALVLSNAPGFNRIAGHSVMAVITSADNAPWVLDTPIADLKSAGLPSPSVVRMKLFTLDHRFVLRRAGRLASNDARAVDASLVALLFPQEIMSKKR